MEPDESSPREPPSDPEAWTDDEWLAWLKSTDDDPPESTDPPSLASRAAHSAVGVALGQAMLGMAQAIYGRTTDDVIIVAEGDGPSRDDEPYSVQLDFEHPERSSVIFNERPAESRDEESP